jgi:hypothetical protein
MDVDAKTSGSSVAIERQRSTDHRDCRTEVVDCLPLPACSVAQAAMGKSHWLWWSQWGHGGNEGGWFFGEQLLMVVTQQGAITGWLLGPAETDDRWLMQAFVSARAGQMKFVAPDKRPRMGRHAPCTLRAGKFCHRWRLGSQQATLIWQTEASMVRAGSSTGSPLEQEW